MDSTQIISELNRIAAAIDSSENPQRSLVARNITDLASRISKKKTKKKAPKSQKRGKCVFPHTSPKVKDKKDHFPINDESQARNALGRANQYDKSPPWYSGSLKELVNAVARKVKSTYPDIDVSDKSKKPGKGKGKKKKASVTPEETSRALRQIADTIDNSKNPRRSLVVADLKRVSTLFEEIGRAELEEESPTEDEGHASCEEKDVQGYS